MPSRFPKLDSLPVEILQRIATYGPCESALALLRVNRAIHQACNDRLVFKGIINNGNGPSREIPVWLCKVLTLQSPVSSWAHYALADSKIAHMPISSNGHISLMDCDFRQQEHWIGAQFLKYGAPQLMASHHPLVDCANAIALHICLRELEDNSGSIQLAQALSFCLAARIMSREFHNMHQHLTLSGRIVHIGEELKRVLRNALYDSAEVPMISAQRPEVLALKHMFANRAVAIFSFDLRCALNGNRVRNRTHLQEPHSSGALLYPPTTLDIPFLEFMNMPLPFSPNAVENFGTCHLSTMASTAFLEDGEWGGYYCWSIARTDNVNFDPPMTRVRFVTAIQGDDPCKLCLFADGIDSVGPFHLQGEIDSETGRVLMKKQYNIGRGWSWNWFGLMTPFGIVGNWGSSSQGGWFWLWKTKWLDGDGTI